MHLKSLRFPTGAQNAFFVSLDWHAAIAHMRPMALLRMLGVSWSK
jgi:hypothetical protein